MGHIDLSGIEYWLPDGRLLLNDINFRVGDGAKVAIVGPNGSGKTTLIKMICGDLAPHAGKVAISGGLGIMRQFIGQVRDESTVRDLLVSISPSKIQEAALRVQRAEELMNERNTEKDQLNFAQAISDWGDAGGYDAEVMWDMCCTSALNKTYDEVSHRLVNTLSGGEQKKLVLQALLRGPDETLILDEPDNYLDVPAKRWLENELINTGKTVFFVSHDRELLNKVAQKIVTVELGATGNTVWVHGGNFATWHDARKARQERFAELLLRWNQEHDRLINLVKTLQVQAASSPDMASKYRAMQTRLRKFEEVGPPEAPPLEQDVKVTLRGARTGLRVLTCEKLQLTGLTDPFDLELFYGDRVAILGQNGTGKSHFLRALSGDESVKYSGSFKLGARVTPGFFAQTHAHPEFIGKTLVEILWEEASLQLGPAKSVLSRYELSQQSDQRFESLSGGQQARFQILLLELQGSTMLLLDEPTDNLDLASAEALEEGLAGYSGTVLAVTHDRWFTRGFDRYLVFPATGGVYEAKEPVWEY
ncbi:Uup ATPase components of ABC transporters with duplicated ATPase domains [actinobacterium SCGC AAA044-D11]